MTRAAWTDIALALAGLRRKLLEQPRQRAAHVKRAEGVDLAARVICSTLRARSRRFDARRFMRIVRLNTK